MTLFLWGGLAALGYAFYQQNAPELVTLGLNLGFQAWRFREPIPASLVVMGALGVGFVLGWAMGFLRASLGSKRNPTFGSEAVDVESPAADW